MNLEVMLVKIGKSLEQNIKAIFVTILGYYIWVI